MPDPLDSRSRPGADEPASAAAPTPSPPRERRLCARVAYAEGDRVLQSMRVPALAELRVGRSERNELVLPDTPFGDTHTLLARDAERWWLVLPDGVTARARVDGEASTVDAHVRAGRAQRRGSDTWVPLDAEHPSALPSVVLELGTGRLLVALEERRGARVAPLPRALQTGLGGQVDWRFAGTLSTVMLAFFLVGLAAEAADPLLDHTPPAAALAFRPLFDTPPLPPRDPANLPEPEVAQVSDDRGAENVSPPRTARRSGPSTPPRTPGDRALPSAGDTPRLSADDARRQSQQLLGSLGDLGLRDGLAGGAAVSNAAALLDDVREGHSNASPSTLGLTPRSGRDTSGRSLGALLPGRATGPIAEGDAVRETPLRVGIARPQPATGSGLLSHASVTRAIRARIGAIRRCYERTLSSHPAARGRVVVSFRVELSGAFSSVNAVENATGDAQLAACMTGILSRLRVPTGPEGGTVGFRYPFVFEPG